MISDKTQTWLNVIVSALVMTGMILSQVAIVEAAPTNPRALAAQARAAETPSAPAPEVVPEVVEEETTPEVIEEEVVAEEAAPQSTAEELEEQTESFPVEETKEEELGEEGEMPSGEEPFTFAARSSVQSVTTSFIDYNELRPGGNIFCSDLGFLDGIDYETAENFDPESDSYPLPEGGTFSWNITDDVLDWEVTGAIVFAVMVKGGPAARAYDYTPDGATSDTGLTAPNNPNSGKPYGISNLGFCYRPGLVVSKTAVPEWTRTWEWGIVKSANPAGPVFLEAGEVATVTYDVVVTATSSVTFKVTGVITITNPTGVVASITSVTDIMTGDIEADVTCAAGDFPFALAAGASTTCSYTADLPNADSRVNTATVTATGVMGGTANADVVFDTTAPTYEIDECIEVTDTNANGPQDEEICIGDLDDKWSKTFTYQVSFAYDAVADVALECGEQTYRNTASFVTNDMEETGRDTVAIDMTVDCPALFCSFSQGYWFAKPGVGLDMKVSLSGHEYTRADRTNIWNIRGRFGGSDAKQAFTQYSAIILSMQAQELTKSDLPTELQDALAVIEGYFTTQNALHGVLTKDSIKYYDSSKSARKAAGVLSSWIDENHCTD